jgi:hypothetical protein
LASVASSIVLTLSRTIERSSIRGVQVN